MKKIQGNKMAPAFLFLFSMFFSCVSSQSLLPVKGSGMAVDRNISVSGFHSIDVSGGIDVVLVQGNSEDLTLTAQQNLFEYIKTEVEQGVLKIYTEKNIQPTKPMKAKITFKNLSELKISGGGDVSGETPVSVPELGVSISGGGDLKTVINTGKLLCNLSGGGNAQIDGEIKNYELKMSGGGDIRSEITAGQIICEVTGGGDINLKNREKASEANISINGGGDITLDMKADKVKCSVSGGGDASLSGQATDLDISMNGGGDINAKQFLADNILFHVSGGSDIHVNASKELTGNISGGGDLYYSGSPAKVNIDAKGGSEVHKE